MYTVGVGSEIKEEAPPTVVAQPAPTSEIAVDPNGELQTPFEQERAKQHVGDVMLPDQPRESQTRDNYVSHCSTTYAHTEHYTIYDIFRRDNQLIIVSPQNSGNFNGISCHFVQSAKTNPISNLGVRGDPNLVAMFGCEIPSSELSEEGDWAVNFYFVDKQGAQIGQEYTICPLPFDEDDHYVSICTAFKDEDLYFRDWIEYHLMVGIEHFYLYDNNSTDKYWAELLPYIEAGIVTYIPFPYEKPQIHILNHCLWKYGKHNTWLEFTDIDEFIFPQNNDKTILPVLDKYRADDNVGSLVILPHNFGTSGHKLRPPGNVIDNYWMRGPIPTPSRTKLIVKTSHCTGLSVHYATQCRGTSAKLEVTELMFNHYFTKSEQDWEVRCRKGTVNGWFVVEPPYLPANPTHEQIEDRSIIEKFSADLKERMEKTMHSVEPIPRHVV